MLFFLDAKREKKNKENLLAHFPISWHFASLVQGSWEESDQSCGKINSGNDSFQDLRSSNGTDVGVQIYLLLAVVHKMPPCSRNDPRRGWHL